MTTDTNTKVTTLGEIGTLTTVVQTFDDSEEVNIFQTLTLNGESNSTIEITNSNTQIPLIGKRSDIVELEELAEFLVLTSFK